MADNIRKQVLMKRLADFFPRLDRNPLTYRTLVYVLFCTTVFALMSTAVQLYLEYRRDMVHLYENIDLIKKSYLPSISASVYKIDSEGLKLQLEGALKLSNIDHLEIKEQRGNEVIETSVGKLASENLIRREYPLSYPNGTVPSRKIGILTVSASLDEIYQRLFSRVLTVLATNTVKTFLASAGILAIIYWQITRHLLRISEYTRALAPGKKDGGLILGRRPSAPTKIDELDQVVQSINLLQNRLNEDIARREASEELLRLAEQKYRTVAEFTNDWEYWANVDDSFEYISPSCQQITGYTPQEFIADPSLLKKIIVAEDHETWNRHIDETHIGRKSREIQFRIQKKDGEIRWIEHTCQKVTDHLGKPQGIRAGNRDITDRKVAEIRLRNAYADIEKLKDQLEAETTYLKEEINLKHNFENIVGNSPALKYVLFRVEQVAPGDTTVLILGESGTGKELIARAIHNRSARKSRSLIKVDCATLPPHLIESELFGHERGAFTGAHNRQLGRFEIADGTTIFLDEIGELPLELQTKLLRVLQDGEFERLGSSKTIKVDIRVIAATNRDLEEEVRKGCFREDLFYRLNVFPITVPPLRHRIEDIPLLVGFFVEKASKRLGKSIEQVPESFVRRLQEYAWPGNVRELTNVIERAVINSSGTKVRLADDLTTRQSRIAGPAFKSLQDVEKEYILRVLEHTDWRIEGTKGAAAILDINPSTLRSRMRKLQIKKS